MHWCAQENLNRKVEETFFQKVALQKGIGWSLFITIGQRTLKNLRFQVNHCFFQSQTQAAEERREIWQNQTFAMQASRLRTILTSAPLLQQYVQDKWGCQIFFSIVRTPLFLSKLWWKYVNLTKPNCPFYPSNVRPALLSLDQWEIETHLLWGKFSIFIIGHEAYRPIRDSNILKRFLNPKQQ